MNTTSGKPLPADFQIGLTICSESAPENGISAIISSMPSREGLLGIT